MKPAKKKSPKRKFNIYTLSHKYKKTMAATISIIIAFSLLVGVFSQFI